MGRPVVLSNGHMFVGLDEHGLVHDFYYPYVGLDNLTNARSIQHKIGIWVNDTFSWIDDGTWQANVALEPTALVSDIELYSAQNQIRLRLHDYIDPATTIFIRQVTIINEGEDERSIRLFMHQVFELSNEGRADTALYVPDGNYILDYKGRCCLGISGKISGSNTSFDQYAVGNYGIEGKNGTFKDAEDGELSNNLVEHGGVDSVLRFSQTVAPGQSFSVDYWIIAASTQSDIQKINAGLQTADFNKILNDTREYWQTWLNQSSPKLAKLPDHHRIAIQKSLLVIKAHCDSHGSVLASGDSSIFNYGRDYYCYCWPRDAAYALWPLIRLGHYQEALNFFGFARDTMHPDGYVMHKYQPDRAIGSTWHPLLHGRSQELAIQEDETASVLFMMSEYYKATQDKHFLESFYVSFITPCANFMTEFVDESTGLPHASYDLWEQKFLTSTYTVSTVIAALLAAAELAAVLEQTANATKWRKAAHQMLEKLDTLYRPELGYFCKGYLLQPDGTLNYDDTLDISNLHGAFMFAELKLDDPRLTATAQAVEGRLLNSSPIGGVIRYEHDDYFLNKRQYKGNPWIVCTVWLAQYYVALDRQAEAMELLDWVFARQHEGSVLSEQYDAENGQTVGVSPLVWSHAELINTILDTSVTTA